jgi:SAM-dependent methyltransferase
MLGAIEGRAAMTDAADAGPNAAQALYWNESAGPTWVRLQAALDAQIRDVGLAAMAALAPAAGERLLDIGCGCGDTTLELAGRVGAAGKVLGADISAPMLAVARQRAAGLANVSFAQADAQVHPFEPVDAIYSRFGVMFFADPAAAFANLRRALRPGGRVAFVCWRSPAENPVLTAAMAAAAPLLPEPPPPPDPIAPGPFAFADKDRVAGILRAAGFTNVSIEPHNSKMGWPDVETGLSLALFIGPLGALLRQHPELHEKVVGAVRGFLEANCGPDGIRLDAATWIVRAS